MGIGNIHVRRSSVSEVACQAKRPPEGGLPAALMKAEIRPRERPRPPILLPSLLNQSTRCWRVLWSQKTCSAGETKQALPKRHSKGIVAARGTPSIPGKWFSSSRLSSSSRRRAHRRTLPSGRSEFWKPPACLPQSELRILRACMARSKLWTLWACRACAAAQSRYNNRGDRRLFASAGIARSFAHLPPRKTYTAKISSQLLAFSSP